MTVHALIDWPTEAVPVDVTYMAALARAQPPGSVTSRLTGEEPAGTSRVVPAAAGTATKVG